MCGDIGSISKPKNKCGFFQKVCYNRNVNCIEREKYPRGTTAERRRHRLEALLVGRRRNAPVSRQGERCAQYPCPVAAVIGLRVNCEVEPCDEHLRRAKGVVKVIFL